MTEQSYNTSGWNSGPAIGYQLGTLDESAVSEQKFTGNIIVGVWVDVYMCIYRFCTFCTLSVYITYVAINILSFCYMYIIWRSLVLKGSLDCGGYVLGGS